MLVKSDLLQLDGEGVEEGLLTITESRLGVTKPLTEEVTSALGVATYEASPVCSRHRCTFEPPRAVAGATIIHGQRGPQVYSGRR